MNQSQLLRLMSYVSIGFAIVLSILAMTGRFSPAAPAYLTFLFTGLVGGFAAGSLRDLDRRIRELERHRP